MVQEGMDVERVSGLAGQLAVQADAIKAVVGVVDGVVASMAGLWFGENFEQFHSSWMGGQRAQANAAQGDIDSVVTTLKTQISQQVKASDGVMVGEGGTAIPVSTGLWNDLKDANDFRKAGMDVKSIYTNLSDLKDFKDFYVKGLDGNVFEQGKLWDQFGTLDKEIRVANGEGFVGGLAEQLSKVKGLEVIGDWAKDGTLVKGLEVGGKIAGGLGVVMGAVSIGQDLAGHDYGRAAYDGVSTALGVAALVTPPPADLICGAASGAMSLGELAYEHRQAIEHFVGDVGKAEVQGVEDVGHAAAQGVKDVGHAVSSAWHNATSWI